MSDLDSEIAEVEHRIADERVESLQALDEYKAHLREQATSFTSLAALVVVGFVAGRLLARRAGRQGVSLTSLLGLASSLVPAVIRARVGRRHQAGPPGETRPARKGAPGEGYLAVEKLRGGPT